MPEGHSPHHPLKVAARVRIPLGVPIAYRNIEKWLLKTDTMFLVCNRYMKCHEPVTNGQAH